MNRFRDLNAILKRISLYDLRSYLERVGWRRIAEPNNKWQVFRLETSLSNKLELILPVEERFTDTKERIGHAVLAISQIEERPSVDVCADIVGTNSDSILVRLQVPEAATSLPIAEASRHVKAIKNLLLYSACSELQARPYYENPLPSSLELITGFEFCHTFSGSFGFEVTSTVSKPKQTSDLFDAPIHRRMVERIAKGLLLLEKSIEGDDPDMLISSYESALNARMCDAIADIGLEGQIAFRFGIDWASSFSPSEEVSLFKEQLIGEPQVNMLKFVSEQLKIVEPHLEQIHGQVVNLHCTTNPIEGNAKRTVSVKVDHKPYGTIEVKMTLGPEFYLLAIEAHSKGKQLTAIGQLQRKGNSWTLESITSLEVLGI